MKILVNFLKWFKHNGWRSILTLVAVVWFLGFVSMKSSDDVAIAFPIVVVILIFLMMPEIKKFIAYYKNL